MKKMILSFMGLVCLYFSHAQTLTNKIEFYGKEMTIHHENIIKTVEGENFAKVDDKFYPIKWKERNTQGPVNYDFYVEKSDGTIHSLSKEYIAHRLEDAKARGVRMRNSREYPDSKPFIRYTSPRSGKKFKFYDFKRTPDGRNITEEEFQSYRGNYKYIRRIDGGDYAMDTAIIEPPTKAAIAAKEKQKADFEAQIGQQAKAFTAVDMDGNSYSLEDLAGKVVVINFWFVSCPPCIKEMPELNNLVDTYGNSEDIVFLGFATDTEERLKKFLGKEQFKYQIFPKSLEIAQDYLVAAYPTSFVIDKEGVITYAHTGLGNTTINDLESKIKEALDD